MYDKELSHDKNLLNAETKHGEFRRLIAKERINIK